MMNAWNHDAPRAWTEHQAAGLQGARRPRVITVTGGKGGVGKSSVAVNLAMTLAMGSDSVMLLDADMSLANVDVMLGLSPALHLGHLLDGQCDLDQLRVGAAHGLQVIPGCSGSRKLAQLNAAEHAAVIRAFDTLPAPPHYLVVDTAAGVSDSVALFAAAADDVLLVVCDEPTSLTDAYAQIKILRRDFHIQRFHMVASMVRNAAEARGLYEKLVKVTDRFLDVAIDFSGMVPHDDHLRHAIRRQTAVVDLWPHCPASLAFKQLAQQVHTWDALDPSPRGHMTFFSDMDVQTAG